MDNNYYYKVYNLIVKSEIKMDELYAVDKTDKYDVLIKRGKVPRELIGKINNYMWYYLDERDMVLKIDNVGNYYIKDGKEIIVEQYEKSNDHYVKTYILGSSFGLLLRQRGNIAIHGGAVKVKDKGIIITGNTGAGKSTLTNAFRHNGYKFLCDDVSVLGSDIKGKIKVMPAYPQQKLCKDSIKNMEYDIKKFKKIDEERDKYAIPVHESFLNEGIELGAICELELSNDINEVEISEVTGQEKVILVLKNIYRIELLKEKFIDNDYFKKCLDLAMSIKIFRVKRPVNKFTVNKQIDLIEKFIL